MDSIKVKVFLENYIFPVFSFVNRFFKHDDRRILFYINSSFRESSKVLYDYMIKTGINRYYHVTVSCADYKILSEQNEEDNVSFVCLKKGFFEFFRTKFVYYSIGRIPVFPAKDQFVMQMWHGVPLKDADKGLKLTHTPKHRYYTWLLSPSEFLKPVYSKWFSYPEDGIYVGGYPRCDLLFEQSEPYDFGDYKKLVIWVPTFRKSIRGMSDVNESDNIIPILATKDFKAFNDFLQSVGVKVIVKLHPEQDLSNYNLVDMQNFILLSHQEFVKKNMNLYLLMKQCDAMITDYSSVYFDYMLLNRPIAFTVDDIKDYGEKRGFALDPSKFMPGHKMQTLDDIKTFVYSVSQGRDDCKEEREEINKLINQYPEGNYCKRIVEFSNLVTE